MVIHEDAMVIHEHARVIHAFTLDKQFRFLSVTQYVPHDFSLGHFRMCEKSAFVTQVHNDYSIGTRSNIKVKTLESS